MAFLRKCARLGAFVGLIAATVPGGALQGQSRHAPVMVEPMGRPRIGTIAPSPASGPVAPYGQTVFPFVPTIITPNGEIFVNLGNGYEQVAPSCPYAYGYACQSYGPPPPGQVTTLPQYVPPSYAAPSYGAPSYTAPSYAPPAQAAPETPVPTYRGGYYSTRAAPRPSNTRRAYSASGAAPTNRAVMHAAPPAAAARSGCPRVVTRRP